MNLEWSADALADLDRFASFLQDQHPRLAQIVAKEILRKSAALIEHPRMGKAIAGRDEYRELVMRVLGANYVFQYRLEAERLVVLRVFHGRETRQE